MYYCYRLKRSYVDSKIHLFFYTFDWYFFVLKFKYIGRKAIEQRKDLNKKLPFKQNEKDFDSTSIRVAQVMFIVVGILLIIVGLFKIFS